MGAAGPCACPYHPGPQALGHHGPERAGAEDPAFSGGGTGLGPGAARHFAEAVGAARREERWALFWDTPGPELSFEDPLAAARAGGSARGAPRIFYNACVPLPLGLDAVGARAASGYYRGARAARRDLDLLVRNAEALLEACHHPS